MMSVAYTAMVRLMTQLGDPTHGFRSVHVVGTNGKSSSTRFIAAILRRHGLRTGAYLSPHLRAYCECIQVDENDLDAEGLVQALMHAAWAAERVNRTLAEGDAVTQFELLTAAAYVALARRGVDVAVVEAGMGGRYDATSVIASTVQVLTNVELEHTRWLGPTAADIASMKLAVVQPHSVVVVGRGLHEDVVRLVHAVADERSTRVVVADEAWQGPLRAAGRFQRRNFALAIAAARAYLEAVGLELDPEAVRDAAEATTVPGRFHVVSSDPPTLLDVAHNPAGMEALIESLDDFQGTRPLGVVLAMLDDKDHEAMLATLLPRAARLWATAADGPRALAPGTIESLARRQRMNDVVCEPDAARALSEARAWAASEVDGVVLATGSFKLVGDLLGTFDAPATPNLRSRSPGLAST